MNKTAIYLIATLVLAVGCNKAKQEDTTTTAETKKVEAPKPPPPPAPPPNPCPEFTLTAPSGKETRYCDVSYTSLKDAKIDGRDAVGKRGRFKCRFVMIGGDGDLRCDGSGITSVFASLGSRAKPVAKTLKRGQRITIDMAILDTGALGPRGWIFDIETKKKR